MHSLKRSNSQIPVFKGLLKSKEKSAIFSKRPGSVVKWSNVLERSIVDQKPLRFDDFEEKQRKRQEERQRKQ